MNSHLLHIIRLLLAVVPAVIGILFTGPGQYAFYTASVLLALLLLKAGDLLPKWRALLLAAELIVFAFIATAFSGLMYIMLFSTLVALFQLKPSFKAASACSMLGLILLVCVLDGKTIDRVAALVLLWVTISVILFRMNELEQRRAETESLYVKLEDSHSQLEAARIRLLAYGSQIEQYAQSEERNRIARDIHDDLGHRLIRVKMMTEAAFHLYQAEPERAHAMVGQIRDQLQESMERMRQTVRKLAEFDHSEIRKYALDQLVEESALALGIEVHFTITGSPRPMYPSMELILFQNAQEAITNAVRHGQAKRIEVTLCYRTNDVSLTVANDGLLPAKPLTSGLGLVGMKERAALLGGSMEWEHTEHFSVTTALPLLGAN